MKLLRQFQRGLSTQLDNNTFGFFKLNDLPDMFPVDGFEVEFVCYVKIRRDGLGVAIDHNGLIACLLDREDTMDTAIVKFNTLTDTIRA